MDVDTVCSTSSGGSPVDENGDESGHVEVPHHPHRLVLEDVT